MSSFNQLKAPSNWLVTANNGTTLTATETSTGSVFSGTPQAFAALFSVPPSGDPVVVWTSNDGVAILDPQGNTVQVVRTFTWATLPTPAAALAAGTKLAYTEDLNCLWRTDGSKWSIVGGTVTLLQSAVASAALTGTTVENSIVTYSLAASPGAGPLLGTDGSLLIKAKLSFNANVAYDRRFRVRLGGSGISGTALVHVYHTSASNTTMSIDASIEARGSISSQLGHNDTQNYVATNAPWLTGAVNTGVSTLLAMTLQNNDNAASVTLQSYSLVLSRP